MFSTKDNTYGRKVNRVRRDHSGSDRRSIQGGVRSTVGQPAVLDFMRRKVQPALLRQLNERAVFETVRSRGSASRSELKRRLGVSVPTISKALKNLMDVGFLEEVDEVAESNAVGRPGRIYRVSTETTQVVGVTIDVHRCSVASAGLDGKIDQGAIDEFPTPQSYERLLGELVQRIRVAMRRRPTTLGIGLSTPGELDARLGKVLLSPNLHLLDGRSPALDLEAKLRIKVVLLHETVGICLAELAYGLARGMRNFVHVGVHEGFSVAVVTDGRLLSGEQGMAGEVGHITVDINGEPCGCGNRGCLQTVATDQAFMRRVSKRLGRHIQLDEIVRLASLGRLDVNDELTLTLEYLAVGIAAVINTFNPALVLVSSQMFDVRRDAFERFVARVRSRALSPLVRSCNILQTSGDKRQGAIAGVLHHLTSTLGPDLEQ